MLGDILIHYRHYSAMRMSGQLQINAKLIPIPTPIFWAMLHQNPKLPIRRNGERPRRVRHRYASTSIMHCGNIRHTTQRERWARKYAFIHQYANPPSLIIRRPLIPTMIQFMVANCRPYSILSAQIADWLKIASMTRSAAIYMVASKTNQICV
jgi:hypothetical protein